MGKTIICADALPWLEKECPPCSIVMSPPDQAEIGGTIEAWQIWYRDACYLAFARLAKGAAGIVYATDRKHAGRWHSKAEIIISAGRAAGVELLWHKIVLRRDPGKADIHRPGYSHLMAFGDSSAKPGVTSADVISRGTMIYPNAMGMIPARLAVEFAGRKDIPLVDPFCGRGTVPAVAAALGFDAIGVDIDETQCTAARGLNLNRA